MKTKAAVLTAVKQPWEIMEVDLRDPKENEVLIRYVAAGLCHSDEHLMTGDLPVPTALHRRPRGRRHRRGGRARGDPGRQARRPRRVLVHSLLRSLPLVLAGQQSICDLGATILEGCLPDGSYPFTIDGAGRGGDVHARHLLPVRGDLGDLGRQGR